MSYIEIQPNYNEIQRVSPAILFTKEQRKETLKNRKNVTNLVKLSTKSCMSRTLNNLKESFIIERYNNNNNLHWKWRFYVTLYVCKVCCLKSHIINLLLTSTAWSLRENIRPRSFMCVLSRSRSDIFPALSVNKKLFLSQHYTGKNLPNPTHFSSVPTFAINSQLFLTVYVSYTL